jgi:type IX secretion system PorP/SprF family membrane protein
LAGLRSNSLGLQYSYQLPISKAFTIRAGIHAAYVLRDVNFDKLTFGDQFDQNGFINQPTAETFNTGARKNFLDLGFGGLLYSENIWLGVSAFHVNKPNQSLIGETSRLPAKFSVHAGYKFFFKPGIMGRGIYATPQERSLAPTVQYRRQGIFTQLDIGLYLTYEPVLFGIWYRGVPYKQFDNFTNNEALVFMVGFEKKAPKDALYIGYSYDFTISQLGASAGGAHEIAISYSFFTGDPRKPPKNVRQIPCRR